MVYFTKTTYSRRNFTALSSTDSIQAALSHVSSVSLANCKFQELKEWEQKLENTLSQVRSSKEERALELQKKLDRQVEEQNELKLCVICLANEKRILCLPCRHLCLCETCAYRQEVTKCPICRLEIAEVLAVYS
uniref:RING-type domain-containing protein n=1 Tax=Hyaloperonospora arabidopsidis (strain Emoy2) TaxID=559515 RepID=M4BY57_HYAAE